MALEAGTRLGTYEILTPLGAGGMGEVYRAKDTKLGREVAIKVLPEGFSDEPERLVRFEREAKVLASLNHNNIATLYGFESEGDAQFLVMELVPGETLADRIARGAIPVQQALPLFLQIAEGLESAHEKGIVHRDLKPANVKVSPEGKIKILDFGLAKALNPLEAVSGSGASGLSQSPTMTLAATMRGEVLGTAAYMSPEQARGQAVDRRADVWAFGICLFEALTGHTVFDGGTVTDTLAMLLQSEPDWDDLPPRAPQPLRDLLRRCLEKEPQERLRDVGEARILIGRLLADPKSLEAQAVAAPTSRIVVAAWSAAALAVGALTASFFGWQLRPPAVEAPGAVRFTVADASGEVFTLLSGLALSPDGRDLVYALGSGEQSRLYHRPLESFDAETTLLEGTEGGQYPFFSPDGEWVGFFLGPGGQRTLSRVSLIDGSLVGITRQPHSGYRASWSSNGDLVLGNQRDGLQILAAGSSALEFIVEPEGGELDIEERRRGRLGEISGQEVAYLHPEWLPVGEAVLYTVMMANTLEARIALLDVPSGKVRTLIEGGSEARYAASGHLVYGYRGDLRAVAFDIDRLEITGESRVVVSGVRMDPLGHTYFSLSRDGTLAYVPGGASEAGQRALVWLSPQGDELSVLAEGFFENPVISPDGRRVAAELRDEGVGQPVILTIDDDGPPVRVTYRETFASDPVWAVDSKDLFFGGGPTAGRATLHRITADGAVREARPVEGTEPENTGAQRPQSVSPDGREMLFRELDPETRDWDVIALDLERGERRPLLASEFNETQARIAPTGDLLSYVSDREGERRVFVTTYPEPSRHVMISPELGSYPRWTPDGREIYYLTGPSMQTVRIETEPELRVVAREELFDASKFSPGNGYDVAPDGRILMLRVASDVDGVDEESRRIHVVLNFFEELKRRVPAD